MEPEKTKIKEYADGWITEREGTDIPTFLKFAYIVIAGGCRHISSSICTER